MCACSQQHSPPEQPLRSCWVSELGALQPCSILVGCSTYETGIWDITLSLLSIDLSSSATCVLWLAGTDGCALIVACASAQTQRHKHALPTM